MNGVFGLGLLSLPIISTILRSCFSCCEVSLIAALHSESKKLVEKDKKIVSKKGKLLVEHTQLIVKD